MVLFIFDQDGKNVAVLEGVDLQEYADSIGGEVVTMLSDQPTELHEPLPDGTWRIPEQVLHAKLSATESEWRDAEMPRAKDNVTAIEYGDEGIPGTALQWQKYWLALRKWTETNPDFPNSSKRPVAPS